jgi:hypothetical protein
MFISGVRLWRYRLGTGVYFAFHLAWRLILVSFLLVCFGSVSAATGF